MPNDNIGFNYDERTGVPTYDEISSTMKRNSKRTKKQNKRKQSSKHAKNAPMPVEAQPSKGHYFALAMGLVLLIALIAGGYFGYQYKDPIFNNVAKITGNFAVATEAERNNPQFGFTIKEVPIDLQEEEDTLILTLNSNCETEKSDVANSVRTQKDNECTNKINPIQAALDKAENNYETYKDKYDSCKEDLDVCEDEDDEE